jgi:chaperonin GroES
LTNPEGGHIFRAQNSRFHNKPAQNLNIIFKEEIERMKIRPLHDRVIVKRLEEKEKTKGGIIIPDSAKETPAEGKVVAVGPGKKEDGKTEPLAVKVNDTVIFSKYAGTEIKVDGEDLLIMREEDILGVLEK